MSTHRILHVLRAPVGGLFRHVRDLAIAQTEAGHDVGILCDASTGDTLTGQKLEELASRLTFGVSRTAMSRGIAASDITAIRTTARLISTHRYDIVHGHGAKGGAYARIGARLNRRSQPVAIYTPHGGSLHYAPDSVQGFIFHNLERLLEHITGGIIFESAYASRAYSAAIGVPVCPSRVIPNGISPADLSPVSEAAEMHDVAFIGELRTLKGIDVLLRAIHQLNMERSQTGNSPITAIIAGDGPDRDALKKLALDLGLGRVTNFVGPQPAREIFAQAKCVAVPSRQESFPYIVLEAAAAGRPVIATSVGGIPEMVAGLDHPLVAPDDVEALAQSLRDVTRQPEQAASNAQRFREHVKQHFLVEHMAARIDRFYADVAIGDRHIETKTMHLPERPPAHR